MLLDHKSSSNLLGSTNSGFGFSNYGWENWLYGPGLPTTPFLPWQDVGLAPGISRGVPTPSDGGTASSTLDISTSRASKTTTGTKSTTDTTTTTTSGTNSTSKLVINISWDSSVSSAPSGFTTAVMNAAQYLESQISDPVTINIAVGYGEVGGQTLGSSTLGASGSYEYAYSYSTIVNALKANATTSIDQNVLTYLGTTPPVNGNFYLTSAQAKSLGLIGSTNSGIDGFAGFSSSLPFTYNDANGVASGTYDFNGTVIHEFTEIMGRVMDVGYNSNYTLFDLLHYSAPGVRDFSGSVAGYFSPDGGTTNMGQLNIASGGDPGDWSSAVANDSYDAFATSGVVNAVSSNDLAVLDALGWNPNSGTTSTTSPTASPSSSPSGVSLAPLTGDLSTAQLSTGLAANTPLATIAEVGGTSGDQYTYTLGGTGAASFTLSNANNTATFSAGPSGVAGAANGSAYELTMTANDATTGTSSPAMPLAVIVGSSGNDTVSVASLVGNLGPTTPTLIYGLGGTDKIDGTGMTSNLWFASGSGSDTMTGGSGINNYMYSSTNDSTSSAMDVITNFASAKDVIDLTGLGTSLNYSGTIKSKGRWGNTLSGHSIGSQISGGNTYVYVNTSGSSESLTGANMKIGLLGSVSLASGNFLA